MWGVSSQTSQRKACAEALCWSGLFGLRASELGKPTVEYGKSYARQTKRIMQTLHKPKAAPRIVIAMDLPSLTDKGNSLIAQFE